MAKRTCVVDGCERGHNAHGYCLMHYMRVKRTGDPGEASPKPVRRVCSISGCGGEHKGHGFCGKHLARLQRTGDPFAEPRGGPGFKAEHGTPARYEYHKCRCEPCVEAGAANRRRWTAKVENRQRRAEYQRELRKLIRLKLAKIKMETGCSDCGYAVHPSALDFDHVRGEKIFNVSRHATKSWSDVVVEMQKCEVVCANCHRIRTYNRMQTDGEVDDECVDDSQRSA